MVTNKVATPPIDDTDTDFIELKLNDGKKGHNKKLSVHVIEHNFSKVAENYNVEKENNQRAIESVKNAAKPTKSASTLKLIDQSDSESDSDNIDDWKEMNTWIEYPDLFDFKGRNLRDVFGKKDDETEGASKDAFAKTRAIRATGNVTKFDTGSQEYTRVAMEKQATNYLEMNHSFDFLFQNEDDNLRKLHKKEKPQSFVDTFDDDFKKLQESSDQSDMTVDKELWTTKSMLNGSQKIAYAALTKLIVVEQHMKLDEITCIESTSVMKKLAKAQKSFTRWSVHVMNELYEHLGIVKPEEKQMIENLSCHGIEASDLVKWFDTELVMDRSLIKSQKELKMIDMDENKGSQISIDLRWTLVCDLFLILLESSVYDARSRTMLLKFGEYLGIKHVEIYQFERRITGALEMDEITAMVNRQTTWADGDLLREHKKRGLGKKAVKIAFATVAGGLVIGLSAGALAPVIGAGVAAGLSTIGIGGTAGIFAGTAGTSVITAGGVLTGMRIGEKGMVNRVGSVKTFEFKPLHNNGRLNLILTVSGWMSGKMDDIRLPFSTVDPVMGDLYSLLWEPDMLTSMGQTIEILANEILQQSIQQILGVTILITLMSAIQLPMWLSKLSYLLDNPWNVSLNRAESSGHILADTLRRNKLGVRPITLVGFSLGAKVIFSCLQDLAKTGDYGIVENVYMFGAPVVTSTASIALARSVVSGRFVNGYSKQDWILGYLFRATSGGWRSVAGLSPMEGVENMDCTSMVKGHMEYRKVMPKLLRRAGWEVMSDTFVEIQKPDAEAADRQRKLISDFERARHSGKKQKWYSRLFGKKNKDWWQMYEEGLNEAKKDEAKKSADKDEAKKNSDKDELFDVQELERAVATIEVEAKVRKEGGDGSEQVEEEDDGSSKSTKGDEEQEVKDKENDHKYQEKEDEEGKCDDEDRHEDIHKREEKHEVQPDNENEEATKPHN